MQFRADYLATQSAEHKSSFLSWYLACPTSVCCSSTLLLMKLIQLIFISLFLCSLSEQPYSANTGIQRAWLSMMKAGQLAN